MQFGVFFDGCVETTIDVLVDVAEGVRGGERVAKGVDGKRRDCDGRVLGSMRGRRRQWLSSSERGRKCETGR